MKKTKSQTTLSKKLKEAIYKDMKDAYDEAAYETHDPYGTLQTLQELGAGAMPYTEAVIKEIEQMENDSFSQLHNVWD